MTMKPNPSGFFRALSRKTRMRISALVLVGFLLGAGAVASSRKAEAVCCACVFAAHAATQAHITLQFQLHQLWMVEVFFKQYILRAMMMMTEQLTVVAMQQMFMVGGFFDAKHQLETQRLFQQLQAQAHKDYHPSEGICEIGTAARALAASDRKAEFNMIALSQHSMQRQLLSNKGSSGVGTAGDITDRVQKFKNTYCDPADNNSGLDTMCGGGGPANRRNKDVDYTRAIEAPLTLKVDFTNGTSAPDEEDLIAMSKNLYAHTLFRTLPETYMSTGKNQEKYLDGRAVMAKRSVAQNSFDAIVGMKSEGTGGSSAFLGAILRELAMPDNEIKEVLGSEKPSYFAQMELLTKKIYQNPDFYTNLYDKPVNVARKGVAMQAIQLMQDRDLYRSQLRTESMLSVLLEIEISKLQDSVQNEWDGITGGEGVDTGTLPTTTTGP